MGHPKRAGGGSESANSHRRFGYQLIVIIVAAVVYFGCAFSPPYLMDDVDAVQAQIAHNMLDSGDWVTARLDGVPFPSDRAYTRVYRLQPAWGCFYSHAS